MGNKIPYAGAVQSKFFFNNNEKNSQKQQKDWCAGGRARGQGGWNEVSKREGP